MTHKRFLGSGMKFPPQIDKSTGRFVLSAGEQSVKESIYLILMTHRGERWLEPMFGARLLDYSFMDTSPTILGLMKNDLMSVLLEQEPRISDVTVTIDPTVRDGCLLINISYVIAQTNTRDNLVFPFYLNVEPEEESNGQIE
ncbi:MAG TPA: GPW/gp25 family protein [Candidatus Agathobaculum merdigallinarum]|nr:GPW/gp25 family protein [Candidatus Agathobaculum merdigallinarum]